MDQIAETIWTLGRRLFLVQTDVGNHRLHQSVESMVMLSEPSGTCGASDKPRAATEQDAVQLII